MSFVGIIANPASGKDIRRLVAYGSVFDNQEKVRIVRRLILGLLAVGVEQICYMPDAFGIVRRAIEPLRLKVPVFPVAFKPTATQEDSVTAGRLMTERNVGCIVTLGGDGTNRAVVKGSGAMTPILPISTGTNNVFPRMIEGTLAGLAAGLVACGLVPVAEAATRSTALEVRRYTRDGACVQTDIALVDMAVYEDWFVGSRAVWDMSRTRRIFLNRAEPASIGLSSIGGLLRPVLPEEPVGLVLSLGEGGPRVLAPVGPGTVTEIGLSAVELLHPGLEIEVLTRPAVLALDGERELELRDDERVAVRLVLDGPLVVDAVKTMQAAVVRGVMKREGDPARDGQSRGGVMPPGEPRPVEEKREP